MTISSFFSFAGIFLLIISKSFAYEVNECKLCDDLSDNACLLFLQTIFQHAISDSNRLHLLESMFAGDICEQLNAEMCLNTLDRTYSLLDSTEQGKKLIQVCAEKEFEPLLEGELINESVISKFKAARFAGKDCEYCSQSMSDEECLIAIETSFNTLSDEARNRIEEKVLAKFECTIEENEEMNDCNEKELSLDDRFSLLSDYQKLFTLRTACAWGEFAQDNSKQSSTISTSSCSVCETQDLANLCLTEMEKRFNVLKDNEKLNALEVMFPGDACAGLSSASCLSHLQSVLQSINDKHAIKAYKNACDQGVFEQVFTSEELEVVNDKQNAQTQEEKNEFSHCSLCANAVSQSECLDILDNSVFSLPDMRRLTFEKVLLGSETDKNCYGKTDEQCWNKLDSILKEMNSEVRLNYFLDACTLGVLDSYELMYPGKEEKEEKEEDNYATSIVANFITKSLEVINTANDYCSVCDSLPDKDCLGKLTTLFQNLPEQTRMEFEIEAFSSLFDCSKVADKVCVLQLEQALYSLPSEERLSFFKKACSSGIISDSLEEEEDLIQKECSICAEWPDDFCFVELQSRAQLLPTATFRIGLFDSFEDVNSICDGYSPNLCYTLLEKKFTELDEDSQNTILFQMCSKGYLNLPASASENKQIANSAELYNEPISTQLRGQTSVEQRVTIPTSLYVFGLMLGIALFVAVISQGIVFARRYEFRAIQ